MSSAATPSRLHCAAPRHRCRQPLSRPTLLAWTDTAEGVHPTLSAALHGVGRRGKAHARAGWRHACHDRHARWIARRCRAMCIGKQHPALRQSIQMWRMHPVSPAHAIDPIVQVINRNKKNIRPMRRMNERRQQEQQTGKNTHDVDGEKIGYLAAGDNAEASAASSPKIRRVSLTSIQRIRNRNRICTAPAAR